MYDDDAIYFGVLTKDDQPSLLTVSDIKMDFNPKWDAQMANEGRENNSSALGFGLWALGYSQGERDPKAQSPEPKP